MSEPPKLAEAILRRLVGGRDADAVAGDLRETFDARGGGRLWYWRQVLSCLAVRVSFYRRSLPGIGTDFSRALRRIRRNPGYALTAMLCLALALGVNTTLFSFLDSMFFRRLPLPDADRIVQIARDDGGAFCRLGGFLGFRDSLRSVQAQPPAASSIRSKLTAAVSTATSKASPRIIGRCCAWAQRWARGFGKTRRLAKIPKSSSAIVSGKAVLAEIPAWLAGKSVCS